MIASVFIWTFNECAEFISQHFPRALESRLSSAGLARTQQLYNNCYAIPRTYLL